MIYEYNYISLIQGSKQIKNQIKTKHYEISS